MKQLTILIAVTLLMTTPTYSQKEKFKSLFNEKDLSGWIVKGKSDDVAKNYWTTADGIIQCNSVGDTAHDYVWLMTKNEYANFHLKLKFAAFKKSKGNSGVQFHSRYDDEAYWLDGPQVDIHTPKPFRCGLVWDETRENKRWIYPDVEGGYVRPKPEWQKAKAPFYYHSNDSALWNEMEIIVKDFHVTTILNGVQVTDFDGKEILSDEIHKKYGVSGKGHICLQLHKKAQLKIWFKDLYIKEL